MIWNRYAWNIKLFHEMISNFNDMPGSAEIMKSSSTSLARLQPLSPFKSHRNPWQLQAARCSRVRLHKLSSGIDRNFSKFRILQKVFWKVLDWDVLRYIEMYWGRASAKPRRSCRIPALWIRWRQRKAAWWVAPTLRPANGEAFWRPSPFQNQLSSDCRTDQEMMGSEK